MEQNFFPQRPTVTPTIYTYRLIGVETHKGYLKVGYTDRTAKERIEEQLHTSKVRYEIVLVESAMSQDGSCFTDKDVHRLLEPDGQDGRMVSLHGDGRDGLHHDPTHRLGQRGEQDGKL